MHLGILQENDKKERIAWIIVEAIHRIVDVYVLLRHACILLQKCLIAIQQKQAQTA